MVLERLPEVRRAFLDTKPLPTGDADVFSVAVVTQRAATPAPVLPPPGPLVGEFTYVVRESARDVFTGITLQWGDDYEIEASGEIWAGVALTGNNGPAGWTDRLVDDARWPLHSGLDPVHAHPFALLARVGGWLYVGDKLGRRRYLSPRPLGLHLRINDDRPGNGRGQFDVIVRPLGCPTCCRVSGAEHPLRLPRRQQTHRRCGWFPSGRDQLVADPTGGGHLAGALRPCVHGRRRRRVTGQRGAAPLSAEPR